MIEAEGKAAALALLRSRQLTILALNPEAGLNRSIFRPRTWGGGKRVFKSRDVQPHFTEWARLLGAGLTITDALRVDIATSRSGRKQSLPETLLIEVRRGVAFHKALEGSVVDLDPMSLALIAAGEKSGRLAQTFDKLAEYHAASSQLRTKIRTALAYPLLVFAATLVVTFVLLYAVVPNIKQIVIDQNPETGADQIVFLLSDLLVDHLTAIVASACVCAFAIGLVIRWRGPSFAFRSTVGRLPALRRIFDRLEIARYVRVLGALTSANLLIADAVKIANEGWTSPNLKRAGGEIATSLSEGRSLSAAFKQTEKIPNHVVEMAHLGEQSGELGRILLEVAHRFDMELQQRLTILSNILGPALIVIMGLLVGFVVMSTMNVLFSLSESALR